jgi:hypothetical protein
MNPTVQRALVYCGPAMLATLFAGLIFAHWVPPPSANDSATEVARLYQDHTDGIRIAAILAGLGGVLYGAFSAVIAAQMKRIEGLYSPLAWAVLVGGAATVVTVTVPSFFWMAAAFEPERNAEITDALHSAGWLSLVVAIFPAIVQYCAIAAAAFMDRTGEPVFPRWLGYLNIWAALLLLPAVLILFFKTGPFAWHGVFTFWLGAVVLAIWIGTLVVVLLRGIAQQEAEQVDGQMGYEPGTAEQLLAGTSVD